MKDNHIIILLTLFFTFMMGIWCIDVSVSALNMGGVLTNGWRVMDPTLMYHFAVYDVIVSVFGIALLTVRAASGVKCSRN